MSNNIDRLKAGIRPLLDKTLENALSRRIAEEFPRIGGPRICKLCAEMILEVVYNHIRSKESVHHGQVVWTAVSKDHPPDRRHRIAETDLVTVVLDVSTAEDIQLRIDRVSNPQRKLHKALRMCRQAYKQGGLLNNFDLSEILSIRMKRKVHVKVCPNYVEGLVFRNQLPPHSRIVLAFENPSDNHYALPDRHGTLPLCIFRPWERWFCGSFGVKYGGYSTIESEDRKH